MKIVARNRKAFHNYEVLEKIEVGIVLQGTEVKSIRAGKINLSDSYAVCTDGELMLKSLHISPFEQGNIFNHDPYRQRKLLIHKKQIRHLTSEVDRKRLTLIPLSVYFQKQWVKVEIGLCRGRKKYDKRQKMATQDSKKRLANIMKY